MTQRIIKCCWAFLVVLMCIGCGQLLQPNIQQSLVKIKAGDYALDPQHTALLFKVNHMGFSTFVGRFKQVDASLNYNAEDITLSTLQAVVEMASVDVNNEKFERALRGKFWFNTEAYPQAVFSTRSATRVSEQQIMFHGVLTFLGQEGEVDLLVTINGAANNMLTGKYTMGFSGEARFHRSDFGVDKYIPAVGDEITLEVHAEFQKN